MSSSRSNSSNAVAQGHSSRRDNQSVSSNHSGRSERTGSSRAHPAVESAVTRLLMSIKMLLEALTQWSLMQVDEINVSDVYVQLGNDFNAAVAAFAAFNIDMNELLSVPDDLRTVLEQCLAEDPTPENLEIYLPNVRQIITHLLQGLRGKQSIYRRIVSDHRRRSEQSGHERTDSRSSRTDRTARREPSHRSQLSRTIAENGEYRTSGSSSGRRSLGQSSREQLNGTSSFVGGFSPQVTSLPLGPDPEISGELPNPHEAPGPASILPPNEPPPPDPSLDDESSATTETPPVSAQPTVPSSVKRYSLVDKPMMSPPPAPNLVVEPSSPEQAFDERNGSPETPPSETPPIDAAQAPAMADSLAALKQSDALERRASKRYSTYNISKMTGSTSRERSVRGQANRRSMAVSSALTPGELAVLTEVDDEETSSPPPTRGGGSSSVSLRSPSRGSERHATTPPLPPLPSTPARTPEPPEAPFSTKKPATAFTSEEEPETSKLTVFLQLGREVKKATIEPGMSFSSLRVLFVDRFSYNPGLDNFPAIYIRDPSSGVQYELEDMDEVKEKCLLSLNIEPLDQIKQHIDTQISTLSQDIKELRSAVVSNKRQSAQFPSIASQPLAESTPAPPRPTDKQFQHVARRLSRFVGSASSPSSPHTPTPVPSIMPQITGQSLQPQMTGSSVFSEYSTRVMTDLKTQFDEVQNLRRDLGVVRQLYTEFMKQTKESLGTLRTQTQSVKQLANVSVGGARAFVDAGKKNLDTRSQNILTEVERLQDAIDTVKADVLKRHITPKPQYMKTVQKDVNAAASELESLKEHIMTIKPMWKKTWQEELQNIVEEQQFMNHNEELLNDLLEDHKALAELFGHLQQVVSMGTQRIPKGRQFQLPPPEDGHSGLSTVMMEIRGAAVDPEKRLKAIEESRKIRAKELESQSDDLRAELTDFVGGKKLRMTGGAEEAERVRQKRNELTLKAMFNGGGVGGAAVVGGEASPSSLPDISSGS
ncbi:AIP3-domain-containing protein [Guyanagaster necrorhizus]|uniref:AIP3-domain-containing protein n=1 Tax=Guyanagaster necrorhizus TaxID=856835 RepID=A0A9P8AQV1_9AGAR|nr:AIP3-domain-containing protein [Guyanagaster necrorhizus MCA 3950]KAG7444395.1 AIP3-domain-containing protein [Guyanagaster necrorhizus MCA 3950]